MTEVSNLLGKERDDIKRIGREAVVEFLAKCNERSDSSAELTSRPEFNRLGITDVAIATAANATVFVLTADLPLYLHCSSSGLNVANFNHVRQGAWSQVEVPTSDPAGGSTDAYFHFELLPAADLGVRLSCQKKAPTIVAPFSTASKVPSHPKRAMA